MEENITLTAIPSFLVGHWTDPVGQTGCTALLCPPEGAVASASFLGPSPGTREGILLAPDKKVQRIHALLFTGGSAFGLGAASGVVRWLEEQNIGHPTPFARVPLVPAAVIYDLGVGNPKARPLEEHGYFATSTAPVPRGRVGAVAVVNPIGDVLDENGQVIAGPGVGPGAAAFTPGEVESTTLIAVAMQHMISKPEARRLADAAQTSLARVIRPSHTAWDGDSAFVLSSCVLPPADPMLLGALVQDVVAAAVVDAVRSSRRDWLVLLGFRFEHLPFPTPQRADVPSGQASSWALL